MQSRISILAVLSALALIAPACGAQPTPAFVVSSTAVPGYGGAQATAGIPATGATDTPAAPSTQPPSSGGAYGNGPAATVTGAPPAVAGTPGAQGTGTPGTAGSGTSLLTITQSLQYGAILADGSGVSLYLFTKDTSGTPTCYGDCAAMWPPFLASSGTPGVGTGLDATKLGTTVRTDGTTQITYNGWPLYYYSKDQQPGLTNGQGLNGAWFLVNPNGEPVQ